VKKNSVGYASFTQSVSFALLAVWIPDQKTSGMTSTEWAQNRGTERLQAAEYLNFCFVFDGGQGQNCTGNRVVPTRGLSVFVFLHNFSDVLTDNPEVFVTHGIFTPDQCNRAVTG